MRFAWMAAGVLATGLMVARPAAAAVTVIDFENLAAPNSYYVPNYTALTSDGMLFLGVGAVGGPGAGIVGQNAPNNADPGGASLYNATAGGQLLMHTGDDNDRFQLLSVDVAEFANDGSGGRIQFNFFQGAGNFIGRVTVNLDNVAGYQTFSFAMPGVSQVSFNGEYPGSGSLQFQMDNFKVDGLRGVVPEPSTWALMLLGFGGLGAALRRPRLAAA